MDIRDIGTGVDIVSIGRFRKYRQREGEAFLARFFTGAELDYCFGMEEPAPHLAGRFAGKEAAVKALGSMGRPAPEYQNIEVVNDDTGAPRINFYNYDTHSLCARVSVSHSEDHAVAFVIILETDTDA